MTSVSTACLCCGLDHGAHRAGCPYYEPEPTVTAEEVAAGIPEDISRAYDRLVADGMPPEKVAPMVVAMKQQHDSGAISRTLEQQVDHLLMLRRSMRRETSVMGDDR